MLKEALQLQVTAMVKFALLRYLSEFLTKSFVGLIIGNSKSFHLGAQSTFNMTLSPYLSTLATTYTDEYEINECFIYLA